MIRGDAISPSLHSTGLVTIPTGDELISELSVREIYQIAAANNHRIIGFIQDLADRHIPIPKLGFSGQTSDGLERILESKQSGSDSSRKSIWVAGYEFQLDPLTFTADLIQLAHVANNYSGLGKGGGILFCRLDQEGAYYHSSKIGGGIGTTDWIHHLEDIPPKTLKVNSKFFDLVDRKDDMDRASIQKAMSLEASALDHQGRWDEVEWNDWLRTPSEESLEIVENQSDLSSMAIPTTNESLLEFDPSNFDKRVVGVFRDSDLTLHPKLNNVLFTQTGNPDLDVSTRKQSYDRMILGQRLQEQEIVAAALKSLSLIDDVTPETWERCRKKGFKLLKSFDSVTRHSKLALQALGCPIKPQVW